MNIGCNGHNPARVVGALGRRRAERCTTSPYLGAGEGVACRSRRVGRLVGGRSVGRLPDHLAAALADPPAVVPVACEGSADLEERVRWVGEGAEERVAFGRRQREDLGVELERQVEPRGEVEVGCAADAVEQVDERLDVIVADGFAEEPPPEKLSKGLFASWDELGRALDGVQVGAGVRRRTGRSTGDGLDQLAGATGLGFRAPLATPGARRSKVRAAASEPRSRRGCVLWTLPIPRRLFCHVVNGQSVGEDLLVVAGAPPFSPRGRRGVAGPRRPRLSPTRGAAVAGGPAPQPGLRPFSLAGAR